MRSTRAGLAIKLLAAQTLWLLTISKRAYNIYIKKNIYKYEIIVIPVHKNIIKYYFSFATK
jgi:hypothetical protein